MSYVNRGSCIAIGVIFPVLGTISVALRFLSRRKSKTPTGWDDWFSILALVFDAATGFVLIYGASQDTLGGHSGKYRPSLFSSVEQQWHLFFKLEIAVLALGTVAIGFIKISALFFYRRIFSGKRFNITFRVMLALVVIRTILFSILRLADCGTHLDVIWTSEQDIPKYCLNTIAVEAANGVSDVCFDFFILLMPLFWIWKLKMRLKNKLRASAIFALGGLAILAGCYRAAGLVASAKLTAHGQHGNAKLLGTVQSDDLLGLVSIVLFWSYVEIGVAVVAACLPTLAPLVEGFSFKKSFRRLCVVHRWSRKPSSEFAEARENITSADRFKQANCFTEAEHSSDSVVNSIETSTEILPPDRVITPSGGRDSDVYIRTDIEMYAEERQAQAPALSAREPVWL